ncbi:hypothetical protein [Clostridium perfringens]|uniref:hypothetical protein n=1 Tax=Clostridium perfringens TaxID=1502 RepID=UPI000F5237FF|nr:hypothetical protein [Clostridium perfringens]
MDIYDFKNYDFKNYKYSEKALDNLKKVNKLSNNTRLISIILVMFPFIKYLKTDNFSYVILIFLILILARFIEYKKYTNIKLSLSKESLEDFHDFAYYFYCKKRSKATHSMHLLDLIYCNFERKKYDIVLKLLDSLDMTSPLLQNRRFLCYYYYAKSYEELGLIEKSKEYLLLLNDLVKRNGLSKEAAKIRGIKIIIE